MTERAFAAQLAEDIGTDGVRMVLGVFATDLDRLLGLLGEATAAGDATAFRRAAHGLAGAAGAVGALALERSCRSAMADSATAEKLPEHLAVIAEQAVQARQALAEAVAELGQPD